MKLKVDENLPIEVAGLLAEAGHDALAQLSCRTLTACVTCVGAQADGKTVQPEKAEAWKSAKLRSVRQPPPSHTLDTAVHRWAHLLTKWTRDAKPI